MVPAPGRPAAAGVWSRHGYGRDALAECTAPGEGGLVGPSRLLVRLGEERPGIAVELVLRVVAEVVDDLGEPAVLQLLLGGPLELRQVGKGGRRRLCDLGLHVEPELPELRGVELLDDLEGGVLRERLASASRGRPWRSRR